MDKQVFINDVKRQLTNIFEATSSGQVKIKENKYRCEGFMKAGVLMGVTNNQELAAIMEQVHFTVYGESIAERKHKEHTLWDGGQIDYGRYDTPTFERV